MTASPALDLGTGPGIVLLHGVGAGPGTFAPLARLLADDHRVVVLERPFDPDRPPTLADQARDVARAVVALGLVVPLVVGVSGGATLALVLGIDHPDSVRGLVVHEPLVGAHAPALRLRFAEAAHRAVEGDAAAVEVVRAVMGECTWSRAPEAVRAEVRATAARARAEVPVFAAFDPSTAELDSLRRLRVLATVGARSGPERHDAADVLVDLAGAEVAVVPDAANAVQLDAPGPFAGLVRAWSLAALPSGS